jgi:hypothetical protein
MRVYIEGLLLGVASVVVMLLGGYSVSGFVGVDRLALVISLLGAAVFLAAGYFYKKHHGPLAFSQDGKAIGRTTRFLLGIGTIIGPVKLLFSGIASLKLSGIGIAVLAVCCIPLSGMSVFPLILIGSLFCRAKRSSNDSVILEKSTALTSENKFQKRLNLSWSRFFFMFLGMGAIFILIAALGTIGGGSWEATAAPIILFISVMVFFAFRWRQIRKAVAPEKIAFVDTDQIPRLLIGPVLPAVLWFLLTLVAVTAVAVIPAFLHQSHATK